MFDTILNSEAPLVSIIMITYGHEKYIEEALEGIFVQKYSGPIELIIANDNSPDNTDSVIKKYLQLNPVPKNFAVRYTRHPQNKGAAGNFMWALGKTAGKYIALCEGDDYWTDPQKLQKQVDFMESSDEFSLCFHAALAYDQLANANGVILQVRSKIYTAEEILHNWTIPTASVLLRSSAIDSKAKQRLVNPGYIFGDIILFLSAAENGKLYGMEQCMSVYRIHSGGFMRTLGRERRTGALKYINHHLEMTKDFGGRYKKINYHHAAERYQRFLSEGNYNFRTWLSDLYLWNLYTAKSSFTDFISLDHLKSVVCRFVNFFKMNYSRN